MIISIQPELKDVDFKSLFNWSECAFPIEGREFKWAEAQQHIIVRKNNVAIGHIGFGVFKVIGNEEKTVIGVGGVVVRPEYQAQGIPEAMFEKLNTTNILNSTSTVKTLFCPTRLVSYYERHGYEEYSFPFKFMQEEGYTSTSKFKFMVRGNLGFSSAVSIPSYPW